MPFIQPQVRGVIVGGIGALLAALAIVPAGCSEGPAAVVAGDTVINDVFVEGRLTDAAGAPLANLRVEASNDGGAATTDAAGYYRIVITPGWSGSVAPTSTLYDWNPPARSYQNLSQAMRFQDFAAVSGGAPSGGGGSGGGSSGGGAGGGAGSDAVQLRGTVSDSAGLRLADVPIVDDDNVARGVTDDAGGYVAVVASGWSGTLRPVHSGYTFDPVERAFTDVTASVSNLDFVATAAVTNDGGGDGGDSGGNDSNQNPVAVAAAVAPVRTWHAPPIIVALDASGSHDPDGTIVRYEWIENDLVLAASTEATSQIPLSFGDHRIILRVTDDRGGLGQDEVDVTIEYTDPPPPPPAPIARWNVVPDQTFTGSMGIGVVAFHESGATYGNQGIAKVEFRISGESGTRTVLAPTMNARTATCEFWTQVNASDHADGPVTIDATVYSFGDPDAERALPTLRLYANAGGSLAMPVRYVSPSGDDSNDGLSTAAPKASIWAALASAQSEAGTADGAIVLLMAGDHQWGPQSSPRIETPQRWALITRVSGTTRDQVRITKAAGTTGLKTEKIWIRGVTLTHGVGSTLPIIAGGGYDPDALWLDDCKIQGTEADVPIGFYANWTDVYLTNLEVDLTRFGVFGARIARNCMLTNIREDAIRNVDMAVNITLDTLDRGANGTFHPDFWQYYPGGDFENVILYNYAAYNGDGGFGSAGSYRADGVAMVNVLLEKAGDPLLMTWEWGEHAGSKHLLMWNCSFVNKKFLWRHQGSLESASIVGCYFDSMAYAAESDLPKDEWFRSNHYAEPTGFMNITPGEDVSTGDALFVDAAGGDYRPQTLSRLKARLSAPPTPYDLLGQARSANGASVGALE